MKSIMIMGAVLAALAVAFGAFGAHGLKSRISPDDFTIFETAVKYHMIHALALMILGIIGFHYPDKVVQLPAYVMMLGIFVFSGSLYTLVMAGIRWMGAVTPIGGLALIISWILLAFNLYKSS